VVFVSVGEGEGGSDFDVKGAWLAARNLFAGVDVPEDDFRTYLRRHSTQEAPGYEGGSPSPTPSPVPLKGAVDLYLACACARGDARAIALFRTRYAPVLEGVRSRFGKRAPTADELWADLSARLFVASEGRRLKIEEYAGRSELSAWLRVVVLRLLLNRLDAEKPEAPFEEGVLEGLLVTDASPELALGRAERRDAVRRAFAQAALELSARERRLLRLAFAEGFTIDDLAPLYNVHRATAARWVKEAAAKLATSVKRLLRAELGLTAAQYESWARGMASSMDVSVARYLASEAGT